MADNCYYWVNGQIKVDYLKIDTNVNLSYKEALTNVKKMQTTTILLKDFVRENFQNNNGTTTTASLLAKYFSPEAAESGATFTIYRKTPDQKYYNYVCTLDNRACNFLDYNVVNNQYYHYMAWVEVFTSENTTEYTCYEDRGENGNAKYIGTSFDRWTICDIEESSEDGVFTKTGNLWSLGLNMDNPEFVHNLSVTTWDTLGQYGKVSIGNKNYDSSTFTGLLGDMKEYTLYDLPTHGGIIDGTPPSEFNPNGSINSNYMLYQRLNKKVYRYTEKMNLKNPYARETEKLESWKEFCSNGNLKLLRDLKGNAWIVQIIDSPKNTINLGGNINQTTISFSWQEIENVSDYSIVKIL